MMRECSAPAGKPVPEVPGTEAATVHPAALSGARFLVSKRIEELETLAESQDRELSETVAWREQAEDRVRELAAEWRGVLAALPSTDPDVVDSTFGSLASARADLAACEERHREVGARLHGVRTEVEVLRSVHRSLEDATASVDGAIFGLDQLRSTSRQVFQIIEEERMRIARDMHDGPAQAMANLVLQAEILERLISRDPQLVVNELADFKDSVRAVLDDTRRLIFDLRPMTLDDLGLVPTLRKFVKEYGERAGIPTLLRVTGQEQRLPGSLEATIFRIVQEALNNVGRHAHASAVEVSVKFQPDTIEVSVRDNGVGMDVAATEGSLDTTRHFGLISMRERAELEKGQLRITSQPGVGTEVNCRLPLQPPER
jgi:two-component system, NarL family, sensor histidine kinase DegS